MVFRYQICSTDRFTVVLEMYRNDRTYKKVMAKYANPILLIPN